MPDPTKTVPGQASAPGDEGQSGGKQAEIQGQQADKIAALIEDISLEDVPENVRELVKSKLASKVQNYDKGVRSKFKTIAAEKRALEAERATLEPLKKFQQQLDSDPKLANAVQKAIVSFREGVVDNPNKAGSEAKKILDRWMEKAEPEQREQLRELRTAIRQETAEYAELKTQIGSLQEKLNAIESTASIGIIDRVDRQISALKDEFGEEFVSKYEKAVRDSALRNPNHTARKILKVVADDEEYDRAILNRAEHLKKKDLEKKKAASSPGNISGLTGKVDVPRDPKTGRINWGGWVGNLKNAGVFR